MAAIVSLIVGLILAGIVLLLLEVLTPSLGLLGTLAVASLVGAVYFAFTINPVVGWVLLCLLAVTMPIYLVLLVRWLPHSPLGKHVFLGRIKVSRGEGTPEADTYQGLVGKSGVAETQLGPSGAVRVEHQRIIALAESGVIEKGEAVTVIKATGTNVIVRRDRPAE